MAGIVAQSVFALLAVLTLVMAAATVAKAVAVTTIVGLTIIRQAAVAQADILEAVVTALVRQVAPHRAMQAQVAVVVAQVFMQVYSAVLVAAVQVSTVKVRLVERVGRGLQAAAVVALTKQMVLLVLKVRVALGRLLPRRTILLQGHLAVLLAAVQAVGTQPLQTVVFTTAV